jgi:exopolyphosphatase / guanosine-5'-triphosphate,3'-diphosphate pyrophosphatase
MPSFIHRHLNRKAIAAIDLGSNALRASVAVLEGENLVVVKNHRSPLRLGEDVFKTGEISSLKMQLTEEEFIKLLHFFTEYNVTQTRAVATSAFRESSNAQELKQRILHSTGIEIETISGLQEAQLIFQAVRQVLPLKNKTALLMDVGGGSTELILVKDDEIIAMESFKVGTVRLLNYDNPQELEVNIRLEIKKMLQFISQHFERKKIDCFIGTGGNLRRIGKIRKKMLGQSSSQMATKGEITHMQESILSMSYVERIRRLELDQNRADVILPAIMLTKLLLDELKIERVLLPKVGLKEGILLSVLESRPKKLLLKD